MGDVGAADTAWDIQNVMKVVLEEIIAGLDRQAVGDGLLAASIAHDAESVVRRTTTIWSIGSTGRWREFCWESCLVCWKDGVGRC